jgi:hypothetical protein
MVVASLLEDGADPNGKIEGISVWNQVLRFICEVPWIQDVVRYQSCLLSTLEVMWLLLEAGADPQAYISVGETKLPAIAVIDKAFGKRFPQQTTELKELIRKKLQEKVGISRAVEIEQGWAMMSPEGQRRLRPTTKSNQEQNPTMQSSFSNRRR